MRLLRTTRLLYSAIIFIQVSIFCPPWAHYAKRVVLESNQLCFLFAETNLNSFIWINFLLNAALPFAYSLIKDTPLNGLAVPPKRSSVVGWCIYGEGGRTRTSKHVLPMHSCFVAVMIQCLEVRPEGPTN